MYVVCVHMLVHVHCIPTYMFLVFSFAGGASVWRHCPHRLLVALDLLPSENKSESRLESQAESHWNRMGIASLIEIWASMPIWASGRPMFLRISCMFEFGGVDIGG